MSVNINASTTNGLVLTSDTSGEIKLQANGADIATVSSTGIAMAAGKTLPAAALTGSLPAGMGGKILQVVQTRTNSVATYVRDDYISALQTSITPASTSSKILITITIGGISADSNADMGMDIYRGATQLDIGTGASGTNCTFLAGGMNLASSDTRQGVFTYLDSPSTTSSIDYKFRCRINSGRTMYMNRRAQLYDFACISSVTLMEVAG